MWLPILIVVVACSEREQRTLVTEPTDARQYVTGDAAQRLDSSGFFQLTSPPPQSGLITQSRAESIAVATARAFGPFMRSYLERQHGGPVDFTRLEADPRAYFAESPYAQDVLKDFHPAVRKAFGPYYLVTLTSNGVPTLSVSVSALDTDVTVDAEGRPLFAQRHGNDFRIQGIGPRHADGMPVSPEHAARIASQTLAARVVAVPELVLPSRDNVPQYARWRLTLERAVTVRRASQSNPDPIETQIVFVGLRGELSVPALQQRSAPRTIDPVTARQVEVPTRPGFSIDFDPITR